MASFDDLPDEFEGIDFDAIPALALPRSTSDSPYLFDEVYNDEFFAQLDALEQSYSSEACPKKKPHVSRFFPANEQPSSRAPMPVAQQNSNPDKVVNHKRVNSTTSKDNGPQKVHSRKHELSSPPQNMPKKKGKMRKENIAEVLERFEDEMTCPICCDIFVAAHLGNPCGHSFCGECGWNWIGKNKKAPTCAVCRGKLTKSAPMIPNFAMDNTVEKHVQALESNGNKEWGKGESKLKEREARKEKWKKILAEKAQGSSKGASRDRTRGINYVPVSDEDLFRFVADEDDGDGTYEEFYAGDVRVTVRTRSGRRG